MTLYPICQARLVLTICHHKVPTTIAILLTTFSNILSLILSSVAKMHAACSHSHHNVLHSHSWH